LPIAPPCRAAGSRKHGPLSLDGRWAAFELDLEELFSFVPERILYRDVITYPPLRLDLAFVVDEGLPAGELMAGIREAAGDELRELRFLSDYRGDPIPAGKKSSRSRSRSSRPSEHSATTTRSVFRDAIVKHVADRFAATLRA